MLDGRYFKRDFARSLCRVGAVVVVGFLATTVQAQQGAAADPTMPPRPVQAASDAAPDWLTLGLQYRFRAENRTGTGFRENASDGYGLNRLLLDVDVKPTSWLNFHFQGQDARAPGKKNAAPTMAICIACS